LKRVALRGDAPALALRGIAVAQLGDLVRAKALLRSAARARIVAITLWPPRASVTAVANPMPLLVPVTNAMATFAALGLYEREAAPTVARDECDLGPATTHLARATAFEPNAAPPKYACGYFSARMSSTFLPCVRQRCSKSIKNPTDKLLTTCPPFGGE
jgi:hypothetical protein